MRQSRAGALLINVFVLIGFTHGQCPDNCNKNGLCNLWAQCECFPGYSGFDCSERVCPSGHRRVDIAHSTDAAHQKVTCSGQGTCDTKTGQCQCYSGYYGDRCERTACPNDCSNRGRCISLRTAAAEYDGWSLNHTNTYSLWDADILHGCQCDPGWKGYDCSQRACDIGSDPRRTDLTHEVVTLTCKCTPTCHGLFKLRFMGVIIPKFLSEKTTGKELAGAIMNSRLSFADGSVHAFSPITGLVNGSSENVPVCAPNTTSKTRITFRRQAGDVPAISFYQNRMSGGYIYFEV